uniref:Uncharacterized protein n=1 Tax=Hordeum vulgare subsp. vulgare TaxID=112509 RepID=A0A8I6WB53_HORVV
MPYLYIYPTSFSEKCFFPAAQERALSWTPVSILPPFELYDCIELPLVINSKTLMEEPSSSCCDCSSFLY